MFDVPMPQIHSYRAIGKAVLHRMIGLRDNYTYTEADYPKACKDCPIGRTRSIFHSFPDSKEYRAAIDKCKECEHDMKCHIAEVKGSELYKNFIKYCNEENRFGRENKIKANGIKLFLTYHMLCSNEYGIVSNLTVKFLSEKVGCSPKAIRYNNDLLQKKGYICISEADSEGVFQIAICNYTAYFEKAQNGGRGFFTLSKEIYESLLSLKSTNQLRIFLKVMLDSELPSPNKIDNTYYQPYKDLRLYLPKYCKRNVIRKTLDGVKSVLFSVTLETDYVSFDLLRALDGKENKQKQISHYLNVLDGSLENTAREIKESILQERYPVYSDNYFKRQQELIEISYPVKQYCPLEYKELRFDDKQIKEFANIALDSSPSLVLRAISVVYYEYICRNQKIRNLGGLIRQIVNSIIKYDSPAPGTI